MALVRRWRVSCPARRRVLLPAWAAIGIAVTFVGWEVPCLRNTCLRSEVATRAEEANEAHSRLPRAADDERRQLERNLHDGAQTRLVSP